MVVSSATGVSSTVFAADMRVVAQYRHTVFRQPYVKFRTLAAVEHGILNEVMEFWLPALFFQAPR